MGAIQQALVMAGGAAGGTPILIPTSGLIAYWDPRDISTLFQDTAMTTPVTASGQTVQAIRDKSGNNYHAIQNTGVGGTATYVDSGGLKYIDQSTAVFVATITAAQNQAFVLACLAHQTTSLANDVSVFLGTTAGGGTRSLALQYSSNNSLVYGNNASITFGAHPVAINTNQVNTFWFDGSAVSANDRARLRVNGVNRTRTAGSVAGTTTPSTVIAVFPSLTSASGGGVIGQFFGLALYNNASILSSPDIDTLEDEFAAACGITI